MRPKTMIGVGLALIFSACATSPVSNDQATLVPKKNILNSQFLHPEQGTVEITIKRDGGFLGSACSSRLYVNGIPVADLDPGEKVVLHLREGDYILSSWPNGICAGGMSEVKAVVQAGKPLNFRIGSGNTGDPSIQPTAF